MKGWLASLLYGPPDGKRIAFLAGPTRESHLKKRYHDHVLYTVNADGRNLNEIGVMMGMPAWSPDGQRLAVTKPEGDEYALHIVGFDGSNLEGVQRGYGGYMEWSTDGSEIFASKLFDNDDWVGDFGPLHFQGLYAVKADGSGVRSLVPYYGIREGDWPWPYGITVLVA